MAASGAPSPPPAVPISQSRRLASSANPICNRCPGVGPAGARGIQQARSASRLRELLEFLIFYFIFFGPFPVSRVPKPCGDAGAAAAMVTVPALSYGLWRVWSPPSPSDPHPVGWGCLPPPPKPLFPQTFCPAAQRQALHRGTQHSSWGAHQQASPRPWCCRWPPVCSR